MHWGFLLTVLFLLVILGVNAYYGYELAWYTSRQVAYPERVAEGYGSFILWANALVSFCTLAAVVVVWTHSVTKSKTNF